jgi:ElaB/YqjD/DUF883 family membrane-anchored ribosome-binding protein
MTTASDKLRNDLRDVAKDIEELLKATAGQGGEQISAARERIEIALKSAQAAMGNVSDEVAERAKQVAGDADDYVHDHPWTTIGIAAGIGFLIGVLAGRR